MRISAACGLFGLSMSVAYKLIVERHPDADGPHAMRQLVSVPPEAHRIGEGVPSQSSVNRNARIWGIA